MSIDFRANQIRTNKLIASGSTGRNAKLIIYPVDVASDLQGGITSGFPSTGIGSDTFVFFSGSKSGFNNPTNGVVTFGGDVFVSGGLRVANPSVFYSTVGVSGAVTFYSTFLANGSAVFSSSIYVAGTSSLAGPVSISGQINASQTATFNGLVIANAGLSASYLNVSGTFTALQTSSFYAPVKVFNGLSASIQTLADGTSYLIAGTNVTIVSGGNGSITISSTGGGSSLPTGSINGVYYYSSSGPALTTSGSSRVPFLGQGSITAPKFSQYLSPIYVGTGNDSNIDSNTAILLGQTVGRIKQEVALNTYSDVYKFSSAYHVFGGSDPGAYLVGTKIVYKSGGTFAVESGEGTNIFPIYINGNYLTLGNNGSVVSINAGADYFTFNSVPVVVYDTSNASVINVLTLYHKVGFSTPAAGVGTRLTFANTNSSQTKTDSFYIDSMFVTASSGQQINKTTFYSVSRSFMGPSAPESKVLEFTNDEFVFGKQPVVHFNGPMRTENYDITGSTYTLNPLLDSGSIRFTHTGSRTINLPAANSIQNKFFGCEWRIHDAARTADSGSITITAPSGVTLNSVLTSSVVLFTKGSAVLVRLITANTWETIGI